MDKSQYKNVYVFVEQRDGVVQNVALELLGKARELADALHEQVVALLLGKGVKDKADELIAAGADVVLSIEADELAQYTTEPYAQAITQVIHERKPSILLIGATSIGRDLGPRLSARIGTGLTADCTGLDISEDGDLLMTRPAFGGNLMATIICKEHRPQMSTVRPGVMRAKAADPTRKGKVEEVKINFDKSKFRVRILETVKEQKNMIDITEAKYSYRAAAVSARQKDSKPCASLPTCSAPKYRLRVRWSMPAFSHTSARSDKPVKRCVRISTSPWVSRVRSNTWPVWRSRTSSSP